MNTRALLVVSLLSLLAGCRREVREPLTRVQRQEMTELDFPVINQTTRTLFVTCFYWAKRDDAIVWRWYKTPIYELAPHEKTVIDFERFANEEERMEIYGWLAVFDTVVDADVATFATTPDEKKIPLGKLASLKKIEHHQLIENQVVLLEDTYEFKQDFIDYRIEPQNPEQRVHLPELDFWVENQMDAPALVNCFVYERNQGSAQWEYDSTEIIRIMPGERKKINITTTTDPYDWVHVHGYLGVYVEDDEHTLNQSPQDAENMLRPQEDQSAIDAFEQAIPSVDSSTDNLAEITRTLLDQRNELILGKLSKIRGRTLVLRKRPYGLEVDRDQKVHTYIVEYSIKN